METWKDIPAYEGHYQISSLGNVRSVVKWVATANNGKQLRPSCVLKPLNDGNYLRVRLSTFGKTKNIRIHRLLALAFIPNPDNKSQVNHKDGNKLNNSIDNLEWATPAENSNHAYAMGLTKPRKGENHYAWGKPSSRRVQIKDYSTGVIYNSVAEASAIAGVSRSHLSSMLTGHRKNKTSLNYL